MRGFLAAMAAAVAMPLLAGPEVVWLETVHDFGAFDESLGTVECVVKGVNTGDEPLVILSARANCGCTTPRYSREPVAPGDTVALAIGYNAVGRPGRFSKNVVVNTNATRSRTTLTIRGTVIGTSNTLRGRYPVAAGGLRLKSDKLIFGEITDNTIGSQYVEGYNASKDSIRIEAIGVPESLSLTLTPPVVPPGELFVLSALIDGSKVGDWDVVSDSFRISNGADTVKISTVAIVREYFSDAELGGKLPEVSVTPREVDFGRIDGNAGVIRRQVRLTNSGKAALYLRKVTCLEPAVKLNFSHKAVKPGKSVTIDVELDTSRLAGRDMLNALLVIITNDPVTPRTAIRLLGEVRKEINQ